MDTGGLDSWNLLKQRLRHLQTELEAKLQELSQLNTSVAQHRQQQQQQQAASSSSGASSSGSRAAILESQIHIVADIKEDIERGLKEATDLVSKLPRHAQNPQQTAQMERFRDIFQDLSRSYRKTAGSLEYQYQHINLMGNARNRRQDSSDASANLIRERTALDTSLTMLDDILGQGTSTRDMLASQRARFKNIGEGVGRLGQYFPDVDRLLHRIGVRHIRERLILGLTIGLCLCFIIWWMLPATEAPYGQTMDSFDAAGEKFAAADADAAAGGADAAQQAGGG